MSVHPSILPRCLGKIVGIFQLFGVVLWKDAPHRLHGWTLICCYPLSYSSLGKIVIKCVAAKCVAATFVAARPLPEFSRFPKNSVLPIYSDHYIIIIIIILFYVLVGIT